MTDSDDEKIEKPRNYVLTEKRAEALARVGRLENNNLKRSERKNR